MGEIIRHEYSPGDRDAWLALRTSMEDRLGGSDLGIAAGHNHYTSPYALFCEKVGLIPPKDLSQSEAVIQGHDLEAYVAERFTRATGKRVHEEFCIFTNSDAPHLKASIDRKIDGEDSGLECKTIKDLVMRKFPRGDFPQQYYDQCAAYLKVTELKRWYLAMLVFGSAFKIFLMTTVKEEEEEYSRIKAKFMSDEPLTKKEADAWDRKYAYLEACYYIDQAELDACEIVAANFIDRVTRFLSGDGDAWPIEEIDDSASTKAAIRQVNPKYSVGSVVTFDESESNFGVTDSGEPYETQNKQGLMKLIDLYLKNKEEVDKLEKQNANIENIIGAVMKDKELFVFPNGRASFTNSKPRKMGDVHRIEEYFQAIHQEVPKGFIYLTHVKRNVAIQAPKAERKGGARRKKK